MSRAVAWEVFSGDAAQTYERYLVPSIFGPFAEDLIPDAALKAGERVLDVACGTGVLTRLAAREVGSGGRVVGLDLNPAMLQVAQTASDPDESIQWLQASAGAVPLLDAQFDVVLCQQGLQFFPDRPSAVREMRRLLVPGGRLVVSVWADIGPGFVALSDGLGRHISADAGMALAKGPASLTDANELLAIVAAAGFHGVTVATRSLTVSFPSPEEFVLRYVASTPLAAAVREADDASRDALLADVSERLKAHVAAGELRFSMATHVLVGRA